MLRYESIVAVALQIHSSASSWCSSDSHNVDRVSAAEALLADTAWHPQPGNHVDCGKQLPAMAGT
jgi:hypothetical protein